MLWSSKATFFRLRTFLRFLIFKPFFEHIQIINWNWRSWQCLVIFTGEIFFTHCFVHKMSCNGKCREITVQTWKTGYKAMFLSRSQNINWKRRGIPLSAVARSNKKGKRALKTFAGTSRGWRDVHRSFLLLATTTTSIILVCICECKRGCKKAKKGSRDVSSHNRSILMPFRPWL